MLVGCLVGPADLGVRGVLLELLDAVPLVEVDSGLSVTQQAIFWEIRLPRVVLGALVGATLAVAGTAYQGVFRNPLADPYLLGVSSGAGLGATLGIVAGGGVGPVGIPLLAFVGGLLGVAATYALGSSVGRRTRGGGDRPGRGRGRRVLQRDPELRPAAVRRLAALGLLVDAGPAQHRRLDGRLDRTAVCRRVLRRHPDVPPHPRRDGGRRRRGRQPRRRPRGGCGWCWC